MIEVAASVLQGITGASATLSRTISPYEVALAVVGIFGGLAGAVAWFRWRLGANTIVLQQQNIGALNERITELETQTRECERRAEAQARQIDMLERLATGQDALVALDKKLDNHHAALLKRLPARGVKQTSGTQASTRSTPRRRGNS